LQEVYEKIVRMKKRSMKIQSRQQLNSYTHLDYA